MATEEIDPSASASDLQVDALASSPKQARFNLMVIGLGLIVTCLLLIAGAAIFGAPNSWVVWFVAGLIAGFTLGTVFGISVGRRLGTTPNFQRFSFAVGIIVLSACVGFFAIPYLTTNSLWPKDQAALGWSIGTSSTLVSATILCLVNFFWHSRDQQRINALRAVVNKNRVKIAEAQASLTAAQVRVDQACAEAEQHRQRAEEAERQRDEERKKSAHAREEAERAHAMAQEAQQSARQAQTIAEREKRWRTNRMLLLGRWQSVEYSAKPRDAVSDAGQEVHKEQERNKDILVFGADDGFCLIHPGKPGGWMKTVATVFAEEKPHESDKPYKKEGRWTLGETGDLISIEYSDGGRETLTIQSLTRVKLTVDKGGADWQVLRTLVKLG